MARLPTLETSCRQTRRSALSGLQNSARQTYCRCDTVNCRQARGRVHGRAIWRHAGATQHQSLDLIFASCGLGAFQQCSLGSVGVFFQGKNRKARGSDPRTSLVKRIGHKVSLDYRDRLRKSCNHGKPPISHRRNKCGLPDSDYRHGHFRPSLLEASIVKARDDDCIKVSICRATGGKDARGRSISVLFALNGGRSARVRQALDHHIRRRGGPGGNQDLIRHSRCRVWIDHQNAHQIMPFPASDACRARRRLARMAATRNPPTIRKLNAVVRVPSA